MQDDRKNSIVSSDTMSKNNNQNNTNNYLNSFLRTNITSSLHRLSRDTIGFNSLNNVNKIQSKRESSPKKSAR